MKAHGFFDDIEEMLADEDFQTDFEVQDDMLDDLRDAIKDAVTPAWIINALTAMHATFPADTSLRYRRAPTTKTCPGSTARGSNDSKTQPSRGDRRGRHRQVTQAGLGELVDLSRLH